MAVRSGHALRAGRQCGEISGRGGRLSCVRAGGDDAWRVRLRKGISRRTLFEGIPDPAHRADQSAAHSQLYRRESAGTTEVLLTLAIVIAMKAPRWFSLLP